MYGTQPPVLVVVENLELRDESDSGHVRRTNGLDFVDGTKTVLGYQLQK